MTYPIADREHEGSAEMIVVAWGEISRLMTSSDAPTTLEFGGPGSKRADESGS